MLFELSDKERELLVLLVKRELDEIGTEIHHTTRREYREDLKIERRIMSELLDRLQVLQPG